MRWRAALVLLLLTTARPAGAYTLASGFSESCHERVTLAAFAVLIEQLDTSRVSLPASELWRPVAAELAAAVLETMGQESTAPLTDQQKFVLFSAVVGVRSPDTAGHSVSNLDALRRAQIDPDPTSQYLHCLRAAADDGPAGDLAVLRGAKELVRKLLTDAATAAQRTSAARNTTVPFYLDFYGQVEVEVDEAAYRSGRAMHVLQDSFSHTLRSADAGTVNTVLNYLDGISGHLEESRDGMGHSDSLDDCHRQDLAPVVERAAAVSSAAARAVVMLARDQDRTGLDRGLARCSAEETDPASCGWLEYVPACEAALDAGDGGAAQAQCCSSANGYCAAPLLGIAREQVTQPYLQTVFGCAVARHTRAGALGLAVALLALAFRARRRRTAAVALVLIAVAWGRPAAAGEMFAAAEGHLSLLSDVPERSIINATLGYALRGGYRWDSWGVLIHVERNHWLPTELSRGIEPGALNVGLGVEYLAAGGRVRTSLAAGPSFLWFDTALDDKGTVGLFVEARPAGLRWRVSDHLRVVLDPLSVALVAPVLGQPGIRQLEYRTLLDLEYVQ
jgi:hypothetical protein